MIAVDIDDLHKTYGRGKKARTALRGVSLQVEAGQIFGFIGPNGAGKSTAIKILVGLVHADQGNATIFGKRCGTLEARKPLGYLPEVSNYQDLLTVWELLARHAHMAGVPSGDLATCCNAALDLVALKHRSKSRLRDLSKGLLQRFGLAQALVAKPSLLVLDEPTSGLDPIAQQELKDVILGLRERGTTIFFSSHQLTDVELMCDAVAVLHEGKMLASCSLSTLLRPSGAVAVRVLYDLSVETMLRDGGWDPQVQDGQICVQSGAARVDALLDSIRSAQGSVVAVEPKRANLTHAYFELLRQGGIS